MIEILLPNGYSITTGTIKRAYEEYKHIGGRTKRIGSIVNDGDSLENVNCLVVNDFGTDIRFGNLTEDQIKEVLSVAFEDNKLNLLEPRFSFTFDFYTDKSLLKGVIDPYIYFNKGSHTPTPCDIFSHSNTIFEDDIDWDEDDEDDE